MKQSHYNLCKNGILGTSNQYHLIVKMQALFTIIFIFSIQFLSAQTADLDPGKWAAELSKKDRSTYDSLSSLIVKLQKVDSVQAFKFLDELAEKGKSKGDHFKALFNSLKASLLYNNDYYEYYRVGKTPANVDWIKEQLIRLYSSAIDIGYRSEDDMLVAFMSHTYGSVITTFGE